MSTDNLSVVLCTDDFPPEQAGTGVVVENLATHLAEKGVEVTVVTLADESKEALGRNSGDYRIVKVDCTDLTNLIGLQTRVAPALIGELREVIRTVDADILHVHNRFFFTSLIGAALHSLPHCANVPLVTTLHLGSMNNLNGAVRWVIPAHESTVGRFILAQSSAVITVSQAAKENCRSFNSDLTEPVVIPNGVDTSLFTPAFGRDHGPPRVLFVGRLVRNKGPQTLIRALPAVADAVPDIKVTVIGTGPMRGTLDRLAVTEGVRDHVEFVDYVPNMSDAMRTADVFCRPSLSEGMPLTVLEAMASGLPSVVTRISGTAELIDDGTTGVLVEPRAVNDVADGVQRLLANPDEARRIGRNARAEVVQNYDWGQRADRVFEVYRQVADRRTVTPYTG